MRRAASPSTATTKRWDANFAFGTGFADGRGHFIVQRPGRSRRRAFAVNDRPWNMEGWQYISNPAYGTGAGQSKHGARTHCSSITSACRNGIAGGIITGNPTSSVTGKSNELRDRLR